MQSYLRYPHFSQIPKLIPHACSVAAVRLYEAERNAKGFTRSGQFPAIFVLSTVGSVNGLRHPPYCV
jgi:hypothetical protein